MTTTILNNLCILRDAVAAQPETLFDLSSYKRVGECGTLFCTAGLAATMPHFKAQGLELYRALNSFYVSVDDIDIADSEHTDVLFGEDAFTRLFAGAANGEWDEELDYNEKYDTGKAVSNMTHKALALARLDKQIAIYKELA